MAVVLMLGQTPDDLPPVRKIPQDPLDRRLPNGKSQHDEIIREDHKKASKTWCNSPSFSGEVKDELEQSDPFIVSLKTVKKLDNIEKLSKDIRGRLKRY